VDSQISNDLTIETTNDLTVGGGYAVGGATITTTGDIYSNGSLYVTDNLYSLDITNIDVNGTFTPAINNTFNLGSTNLYWNNIYANTLNFLTQLTNSQISSDIAANYSKLTDLPANLDTDSTDDITTANIATQTVNKSNYWDNLDSPSDISTSDLNDDGTFYLITNPMGFYNSTNQQTENDPVWITASSDYSTTAEILAFGYYNETDFVITDYFTKAQIYALGYYNLTDFDIGDYFTQAQTLAFNYYNATDFDINNYISLATVLGFNYYNSTDFLISDYIPTATLLGYGYYNSTDFSISDYYPITNPYGYYNSTNFNINNYYEKSNPYGFYNSTTNPSENDPLWTGNQSSYSTTTEMNTAIEAGNTSLYNWITDQSYTVDGITWTNAVNGTLALISDLDDYATNIKVDSLGNWSDDKSDYSTTAEAGDLYYGKSNLFGFYNSTDFNYEDYYLKNNPYGFYNSTNPSPDTDTTYSHLSNFTNDMGYYNSTNPQTETDPNSLHLNQDNWYNDSNDWLSWDGDSIEFNDSKLSSIYYSATSSQAVSGTIDGGTLANTQHSDASYDSVTMNFSEASGSPALDLRINFSGVDSFNRGIMRYKTSDLSGDYPIRQLWSYTNSQWEDYPQLAESVIGFSVVTQPIFDNADHVSGGVIQMRLYKASNGNTNNHYYIDWVAMVKGFGTPSGEEVDPYAIHRDGTVELTDNWNAGAYNITASYFLGNGSQLTGISTTESDPLWTENFTLYNTTWSTDTDTLYTHVSNFTNDLGYYNSSDFSIGDYVTFVILSSYNYYNSTDFDYNDYSTTTDMNTAIENSNTSLYNWVVAQDYTAGGITWSNAINGTLALSSDLNDYTTTSNLLGFSYYNSTDFDYNNYYLKDNPYGFYNSTNKQTETDPVWVAASSDYSTTTEANALYYDISNPMNFYNSTDFSIADYYPKSNPFDFYNVTDFNIADYSTTTEMNTAIENANTTLKNWIDDQAYTSGGITWSDAVNGTLALTSDLSSYTTTSDLLSYEYYNATNTQTETDPLWSSNSTNVPLLDTQNSFSAQQNFTAGINVTADNKLKIGACYQQWNGTCLNTYCSDVLVMSIGCS